MSIRWLPPPLLFNVKGRLPRPCVLSKWYQSRGLSTHEIAQVPFRKHLKDEAKRKKVEQRKTGGSHASKRQLPDAQLDKWELTVGIEVHAELNTTFKLFSDAPAAGPAAPNAHVSVFDSALPGTQPRFQIATLLPALRAAIALGCDIQPRSGWDRKHYFHWDQPNGYQITQYHAPFAKDGKLVLTAEDGVPSSDLDGAETLEIGIKQIQMEQDTAKTIKHPPRTYHVDLNRAGHPLIEIITLPHIHSPQTATAAVRKIQAILKATDSCVTGMELGGLRADVNVSIREIGAHGTGATYSGVSGLGQRTEIKNLASFKAVEDAIIIERDRQIKVLESGGIIESETRGFAVGATETTRLRGKEGEVDYRYMPDADLAPLLISSTIVEHLKLNLPELPHQTVARLQGEYGISLKDAKTLASLDGGDRLEFMEETVALVSQQMTSPRVVIGKAVCNWVLHELGGLLTSTEIGSESNTMTMSSKQLADIVKSLLTKQITSRTAKQLLVIALDQSHTLDIPLSIDEYIDQHNLRLRPLTEAQYMSLAKEIIHESPEMVDAVRTKGQKGKVMWFVGQMVRKGEEGTIEPERARQIMENLLLVQK
nr:glutamyl-trna(gln) amidotransferase subunit b, mitochondrial [Quercus suber]